MATRGVGEVEVGVDMACSFFVGPDEAWQASTDYGLILDSGIPLPEEGAIQTREASRSPSKPAGEKPSLGQGAGDEASPDRRARRLQQRANEVYEAAVELFVERGYEKTTMEDIADRADVARASVFNYFPRKAAFLDEWISRRRRRVAEAIGLKLLDSRSIEEALGRYLDELARVNIDTRAEAVALMAVALGQTHVSGSSSSLTVPPLASEFANYVAQGIVQGEFGSEVRSSRVGILLAHGYFASVIHWTEEEPAPFDLHDELRGLLDIVIRGILTV
jgi:AcrR family transcriptional regulator